MKVQYKRYVGENKPDVETAEWCCRLLQESPEIGIDVRKDDVVVRANPSNRLEGIPQHGFEYCPYCGEEIEIDCLGKFNQTVTEEKVDG